MGFIDLICHYIEPLCAGVYCCLEDGFFLFLFFSLLLAHCVRHSFYQAQHVFAVVLNFSLFFAGNSRTL